MDGGAVERRVAQVFDRLDALEQLLVGERVGLAELAGDPARLRRDLPFAAERIFHVGLAVGNHDFGGQRQPGHLGIDDGVVAIGELRLAIAGHVERDRAGGGAALPQLRAQRGGKRHLDVAREIELGRLELAGALGGRVERLLRGFRLGQRRRAGGQRQHRQQGGEDSFHRASLSISAPGECSFIDDPARRWRRARPVIRPGRR